MAKKLKRKLKSIQTKSEIVNKSHRRRWKTIAIALYFTFLLLSAIPYLANTTIDPELKDTYKYHLIYRNDGRQSHYYVELVNTSQSGVIDLVYTTSSNSLTVDVKNIKVLHIYCRSMYEDECKKVFGIDPYDNTNYYKWYFIEKDHLSVNINADSEIEELSFIDTPIPYKVIVDNIQWFEGIDYYYTDNHTTVLSNVPDGHTNVDIYFKSHEGTPPTAILNVDKTTIPTNTTQFFDGSKSFDPDGTIITHIFDFGDGTFRSGSTASHQYKKPGTYGVILMVLDNDNLVDHAYVNMTVIDTSDVPEIQGVVPDQIKPEDSPPWILNLSSFKPIPSSGNIEFYWHLTGENSSLYLVTGENNSADRLIFTPIPDAFGSNLVKLWLHSNENLSSFQELWINLTPVNDPPTILPLPDLIVHYDDPFTFNYGPYVSDKEIPYYLLTLEVDDTFEEDYISVSGLNATYNYPHSLLGKTIYATVTVSDGEDSAQDVIAIEVTSDYVPKLVEKLPDVWLFEGTTKYNVFDLDDYFTDPDNDAIYFSYGFTHLEIIIRPDHTVDISAASEWTGKEFVTFRAHDPIGAIAEDFIIVTVLPVNDPPTISGVPDFFIRYNYDYRFELTPYVHDNDNLTTELRIIPSDITHIRLDIYNKLVIIMNYPMDYLGQNITVRLMVTDGLDFGFQDINVTITEDFPPELLSPLPDIVFLEDKRYLNAFDLDHYFLDVDGDTLFYTSGNKFVNIVINSDHTVDFSAPQDWFGDELVYFRATDPTGALQQDLVLVSVLPVNDAPVILPIPAQYGNESERWTLELEPYIIDVDNNLSELDILIDNEFIMASGNTLIFFGSKELPKQVEIRVNDGEFETTQIIDIHLKKAKEPKVPTMLNLFMNILPVLVIIITICLVIAGFIYHKKSRFTAEEVFLIHTGGTLITHLTRQKQAHVDDIIFSGMFTAVQEFIRDTFVTGQELDDITAENNWLLDELKLGENNILIERSKHTYLAVIFSGEGSKRLRRVVNRLMDEIESKYSEVLPSWDGNINELKGTKKILSVLIPVEDVRESTEPKPVEPLPEQEMTIQPKPIISPKQLISKPLVMAQAFKKPKKVRFSKAISNLLEKDLTAWPLNKGKLRALSNKDMARLPIALHIHPKRILPKTIKLNDDQIWPQRALTPTSAPACLDPSKVTKTIRISMSEGKELEIDPSRSLLQQLADFEDKE